MGIVGIAYWLLKCSLIILIIRNVSISSYQIEYFRWMSVKYIFRIISLLFQLVFFGSIPASIGTVAHIQNQNISYYLLPCLMLSQLSVFVNAAIDSYSYLIQERIEPLHLDNSMFSLYNMGEPLYLGFALHVFFRFLIINIDLRVETVQPSMDNRKNRGGDGDIIGFENPAINDGDTGGGRSGADEPVGYHVEVDFDNPNFDTERGGDGSAPDRDNTVVDVIAEKKSDDGVDDENDVEDDDDTKELV